MDICLLCVICGQVEFSASRYHLSRGVLPIVTCTTERDREPSIIGRPWPTSGRFVMKKNRDLKGHVHCRQQVKSVTVLHHHDTLCFD